MLITDCIKYNLFITNKNIIQCSQYNFEVEDTKRIISIETYKKFFDLLGETQESKLVQIHGFDIEDFNLLKDILAYAENYKETLKLNFECEVSSLNQDLYNFISNYSLLNLFIIHINIPTFNIVFNDNKKIKLIIDINKETYSKIFKIFQQFSNFNLIKFNIDMNKFIKFSFKQLNEISSQLSLLIDYYIETFKNEDIPLIPICISKMLLKLMLKTFETKENLLTLSYENLLISQCASIIGDQVTVNYNGDIFYCGHCSLKETDLLYRGNIFNISALYNIDFNKIFKISIDKNISTEPTYNLKVLAPLYNCSECLCNNMCTGGCYSDNLILNNTANIASKNNCFWQQELSNGCTTLVSQLETTKNELFKDYLYGITLNPLIGEN